MASPEPRKRTISIPSTMFSIGLRLFTLSLLVSIHDAQRVQLHNCAKMILITGKFWPCIVWQRPNATTTTTSTSTTDASTSTDEGRSSTTEGPTSTEEGKRSTTEGSTTEEITTMDTTTTEILSTSTIPSRREKTTMKKERTTTEEVSTSEVSLTTVVPSTTNGIVDTTTDEEETATTPTTTAAVTKTEMRGKRIKGRTSIPTSTTSSPSTTTEEEEKITKTTTMKPSTTTEEVEIKVVTKETKKGEPSSTSESMEEEEEIFGVVQSTTPPPYFVTLLTDRSRDEFYRIAKNPFLTKAELLYRIRRWASKQPKLVREAIFDIEHELIRQQASVRKEAGAILEALPLAFLQYTNIRDNVALTKQEEQEDLDALYKALPRKTAKVLRYVLMIAGDSFDTARREENKLRQFSLRSFRSTIRDTLG